jgi:predicted Zn-dependent peptidase
VAFALAVSAAATGDVHTFERYLDALAAVTPADVARVAKLLVPAHRDVVTLIAGPAPDPHAAPSKDAKGPKKVTR